MEQKECSVRIRNTAGNSLIKIGAGLPEYTVTH
jgi:hypothetical protein